MCHCLLSLFELSHLLHQFFCNFELHSCKNFPNILNVIIVTLNVDQCILRYWICSFPGRVNHDIWLCSLIQHCSCGVRRIDILSARNVEDILTDSYWSDLKIFSNLYEICVSCNDTQTIELFFCISNCIFHDSCEGYWPYWKTVKLSLFCHALHW